MSAIAMGRVDNRQGKMRGALGGGPAGLSDGWADRLGYGQSKQHGSRHIEEGVSYVAAGTAGKAWSVVEGSSLSLGPSLGQDDIILGSGPRGCACLARQRALSLGVEMIMDGSRRSCWLVGQSTVCGCWVWEKGSRHGGRSGTAGLELLLSWDKEKRGRQQCMALLDEVFAAHPPTAGEKG